MKFRWRMPSEDRSQAQRLEQALDISPLLAHLLVQRGLEDPQAAKAFLDPSIDDLHDPFLMQDMLKGVERLEEAIEKGEKILIYGDYDVDGMTSTTVLKRAVEMLGGEAQFHIPARLKDGYGLQADVMPRIAAAGFRLVVAVDSGVRAFQACLAAKAAGLDLIVADHHLPDRELPDAYAILNPKREDCSYPFKDLAAVGVVFKLVQGLFERAGRSEQTPDFLKMVAIGTVADVVPLLGENRIIVKYGLEGLARPSNPGLRELLSGSGVEGQPGVFDIGFRIAPRMNAVTRMGGGREVVQLFSMRDRRKIKELVLEMNRKNELRRREEDLILSQIDQRAQADPQAFQKKFLVVAGQDWHRGVIGIVASRVAERFHRPTLILSVSDEDTQGSGRSIEGFNLVEALDAHSGCFTRHGGHAAAVGCTLDARSLDDPVLDQVRHQLEAFAEERLQESDLIPTLSIAECLRPEDINDALFDQIEMLAPWGAGNPLPVFAAHGVPCAGGPWVLKERHLKFQVQCNGSRLDALWWKHADMADNISVGEPLTVAFTLSREFFRGVASLTLTVRDIDA